VRSEGERRRGAEIKGVGNIRSFRELKVYQAAMEIFELTKTFPADERFSMVDQIRR
jgi:hypothetical protein